MAGALAAVVLGAALTTAWLVPPLAVPLVWPVLAFVPGWCLVAICRPRLGLPARIGLAVVISTAISTHLVYWLALLAGGYRREIVFLAVGLLVLPIPILATRRWTRRAPAARGAFVHRLRAVLARNAIPLLLAMATAGFVGLVLGASVWRVTSEGVSSGGSNWSDFGVHLSIAQSLNAGNFPPQVPYFAGVPLIYHWFADFHAAIAASAADGFAVPAMVADSALFAGALALLVHGLAMQLLRSRKVAWLAVVLVVIGGGLGYVRLVGDVASGAGDPIGLVMRNSYDNQWLTGWPYFRIPSVMGTGLLVHRATTAGLPILVGATLLLIAGLPTAARRRRGWHDRPLLIGLAGLLGALLAPFQFFFFPTFLLIALLYVAIGGRLTDGHALRNAALFSAPYLLALPFALPAALQSGHSGALKLVAGWESAPFGDGPFAVAFFYLTNLGLPFVLALLALIATRHPWRAFLGAWLLVTFLLPNVVRVSVVDFDMNKLFQAMWIAVALLAAWLIRRWPAPAIAAVLALSVPSPLLVAAWTAGDAMNVLSPDQLRAAAWIAGNTPPRSVFATSGWLNSPTDAAGRLRLTTYGPYVANLGYAPDEREQAVHRIYCGADPVLAARLLGSLRAQYLIAGELPSDCPTPTEFRGAPGFRLVYEHGTVQIYQLALGHGSG